MKYATFRDDTVEVENGLYRELSAEQKLLVPVTAQSIAHRVCVDFIEFHVSCILSSRIKHV